uniref:hypothetical protein n=1 Tax=Sporichthya sp. TaxID=65475 RepID=UPI0017FB85DA|nr:hypothetical protein [Sporichthya sp.]
MSMRTNTHRKQRAGQPATRLPRGARALALTSATALCASLGMTLAATPAQAAVTLTVAVAGNDANPCSSGAPCKTVQRAVNLAGQYAESQDVTINVGAGTFTEAAGVVVNYVGGNPKPLSLTIVGAGADKTTIAPGTATRVFGLVGDFPIALKAMTITGGAPATGATGTAGQPGAAGAPGGGVWKASGTGSLTLTDVAVTNNSAGSGGKGYDGPNGSNGTGIPGNGGNGTPATNGGAGGYGGGVAYSGTGNLVITGSTISANKAGFGGEGGKGGHGGIGDAVGADGEGGNGAIGGNGGAGGAGGGVAFAGNALTVTNSTIVTNLSGRGGNGGAGGSGGRGGDATPENDGGDGAVGGNGGNGGNGGGVEL